MIKRCRDCGNEFVTEHHQKKLCDNCAALHAMITQQKSGKKAKMKRANAVKICALWQRIQRPEVKVLFERMQTQGVEESRKAD